MNLKEIWYIIFLTSIYLFRNKRLRKLAVVMIWSIVLTLCSGWRRICYLRETFGTARNIEHLDLYGFEINSFHLSKRKELWEGVGIEKYLITYVSEWVCQSVWPFLKLYKYWRTWPVEFFISVTFAEHKRIFPSENKASFEFTDVLTITRYRYLLQTRHMMFTTVMYTLCSA